MRTKPGGVRVGIDFQQVYREHLAGGLCPTDGVQYNAVSTFGTTAVEILNSLIDPGYTLQLREKPYFGLTQQFTGVDAASVASMTYYWEA